MTPHPNDAALILHLLNERVGVRVIARAYGVGRNKLTAWAKDQGHKFIRGKAELHRTWVAERDAGIKARAIAEEWGVKITQVQRAILAYRTKIREDLER